MTCSHVWQPDPRFYSWVVCGRCGAPSICKECEQDREGGAAYLPDVFCPHHRSQADAYRTMVLTGPLLGRRIRRLCQTARDYGDRWARCEEGLRVKVVVGDIEVWLHRSVPPQWWRVVLLYAGRLVYHAEGAPSALVVRSLTPGRWITEVQAAQTWRDAEVRV